MDIISSTSGHTAVPMQPLAVFQTPINTYTPVQNQPYQDYSQLHPFTKPLILLQGPQG